MTVLTAADAMYLDGVAVDAVYANGVRAWTAPVALTVDHTKVPADLTDFPLYVDLSLMPDRFWRGVADGGGDIRCYAGGVELPREVVSCDVSTRTGELHVKVDLSSATDTTVSIAVNGQHVDYASSDPYGSQAVWSNGYSAVWHHGAVDSVSGLSLTRADSVVDSPAQLGQGWAQKYVGSTNFTISRYDNSFGLQTPADIPSRSLSMWCTINGSDIQDYYVDGTYSRLYLIDTRGGAENAGYFSDAGWTSVDPPINGGGVTPNWLDAGSMMSVNAQQIDDNRDIAIIPFDEPAHLYLAPTTAFTGMTTFFCRYVLTFQGLPGVFDELRISSVTRSTAWIAAEYANQSDPANFYATA